MKSILSNIKWSVLAVIALVLMPISAFATPRVNVLKWSGNGSDPQSMCKLTGVIGLAGTGQPFGATQSKSFDPNDTISIRGLAANTGTSTAQDVRYEIIKTSPAVAKTHTWKVVVNDTHTEVVTAKFDEDVEVKLVRAQQVKRVQKEDVGNDNPALKITNTLPTSTQQVLDLPAPGGGFGEPHSSLNCEGYGRFEFAASHQPNTWQFEQGVLWQWYATEKSTPPTTDYEVDLTVDDSTIFSGDSTVLRWTTTGPKTDWCEFSDINQQYPSGTKSRTVSPTSTKTYVITCESIDGQTDSDQVTVTVKNNNNNCDDDCDDDKKYTVDLTASDYTIDVGDTTKLSWKTSGDSTDYCEFTDYFWNTYQGNSGSVNAKPQHTKTYTINCVSDSGLHASDSVKIIVDDSCIGNCDDNNDDDCDDNDDCNDDNNSDFDVETLSPTNIEDDRVVFRGEVIDGDNVDTYFVYSRTDSTPECDNGNDSMEDSDDNVDADDQFSETVTGLRSNTMYYYRACGEIGSDIASGKVYSFTTKKGVTTYTNPDDDYVNPDNGNGNKGNQYPIIETLIPTNRGTTWAKLIAQLNANGCSATTYFQYGVSPSALSYQTPAVVQGNIIAQISSTATNLLPGVRYYVRAVATNCNGTSYGNVVSFVLSRGVTTVDTTVRNTTVRTNTNTNTNVVINGGTGSSFLRLDITNDSDSVVRSAFIEYRLEWENLTSSTLNNGKIQVTLPDDLVFLDTTRGRYDRDTHSVYLDLGEIKPHENDIAVIGVQTATRVRAGDIVVIEATAAFDAPQNDAQLNATDYDQDEVVVSQSNGLAAAFGSGWLGLGWFGWLILLMIIGLVYLLARYHALATAQQRYYGAPGAYYPVQPVPTPVTPATHPEQPTQSAEQQQYQYVPYRPDQK